MKAFVEVNVPGKGATSHNLKKPLRVGKAREAEIKLDIEGLPGVALEVEARESGSRVKIVSQSSVPVVYQGMPYSGGVLPWGSDLFVGDVRLQFVQKDPSTNAVNPVLLVALVVALGALAWSALRTSLADEGKRTADQPAVALFSEAVPCSEPATAGHRAKLAKESAQAKLQRYAFFSSDGIGAVRLLSEAQACFAAAGQPAEAEALSPELQKWKAKITGDYQSAHLRFLMARKSGQLLEALAEVKSLKDLLKGNPEPQAQKYFEWLSVQERHISTRIPKKKKRW